MKPFPQRWFVAPLVLAAAIAAAAGLVAVPAVSAGAPSKPKAPTGSGSATLGKGSTGGVVAERGGGAASSAGNGGPASPGSAYWKAVVCTACLANGMVCTASGQMGAVPAKTKKLPAGDTYAVTFYLVVPGDPAAGTWSIGCSAPPPPPSASQVWAVVTGEKQLPQPQIELSPGRDGLVRLPTWLWLADDPRGVDLTVSVPGGINGYAVSVTVHPIAYTWDFGDGQTATSSDAGGPGGTADASAVHTYFSKGTYSVGVTVAWAGSYLFSGYGANATEGLGPVQQDEVLRPYVVQEVRSVLLAPGGR